MEGDDTWLVKLEGGTVDESSGGESGFSHKGFSDTSTDLEESEELAEWGSSRKLKSNNEVGSMLWEEEGLRKGKTEGKNLT